MPRVDAGELESFARALVEAFGTPEGIAAEVAEALVGADLRGHGSHGVRRLGTLYPRMVDAGTLVPDATPTVERERAAAARVDGGRGWGHHAGRYAADLAVEKAREGAVGAVGLRNAAHLGRLGEYAERAADAGVCLVSCINTGGLSPSIAVPGTTERGLPNNPYALGVPTYDVLPFSVVLDVAMSQVAHGKIMKRDVAGEPLPEEWAIGGTGEPLTDAGAYEAGEGAILPLGGAAFGYKGAGLAVAAELLAGMVADGAVIGQDVSGRVNNGAVFVALDPEWFSSREANRARVEALVEHVRSLERREGTPTGQAWGDEWLLPGEPEYERRTAREAEGVPLDEGTVAMLSAVADERGVDERPAGFA